MAMGVSKMVALEWNIPLKWMIFYGYPYFRKPSFTGNRRFSHETWRLRLETILKTTWQANAETADYEPLRLEKSGFLKQTYPLDLMATQSWRLALTIFSSASVDRISILSHHHWSPTRLERMIEPFRKIRKRMIERSAHWNGTSENWSII